MSQLSFSDSRSTNQKEKDAPGKVSGRNGSVTAVEATGEIDQEILSPRRARKKALSLVGHAENSLYAIVLQLE
jgi:hypothetical protein